MPPTARTFRKTVFVDHSDQISRRLRTENIGIVRYIPGYDFPDVHTRYGMQNRAPDGGVAGGLQVRKRTWYFNITLVK